MKVTRRSSIASTAGGFAAVAIPRFPARAAEFNFKWGLNWPANHPFTLRTQEAAQRTLQESDGRLDIHVFPQSQLGGATSRITQVRLGAIEMVTVLYGELGTIVPIAGLTSLPFALTDRKGATDALDGPFGKFVRSSVEKVSLHVFDTAWDGGFRQLSNNVKPIHVPADLGGLRMRVPPEPPLVAVFKAFGASPTTIDASSMYVACQTHLVDGTDLPVSALDGFKMYEVLKYLSIVNHSWTVNAAVINADALKRLPAKTQETLERNVNAAGLAERRDMASLDGTTEQTLTAKGMVVNRPDVNTFKAAVRASGLYAQWRIEYGSTGFDLLEKSVGRLS